MVTSQFGAILKELEKFTGCPLQPDENDSCLIQFPDGLKMQFEIDRFGMFLAGCILGTLSFGRNRGEFIRAALKTNEIDPPFAGIFGYNSKTTQLILFLKVDPQKMNTLELLSLLPPFFVKANKWTDAIASGQPPKVIGESSSKPAGLFGLMS